MPTVCRMETPGCCGTHLSVISDSAPPSAEPFPAVYWVHSLQIQKQRTRIPHRPLTAIGRRGESASPQAHISHSDADLCCLKLTPSKSESTMDTLTPTQQSSHIRSEDLQLGVMKLYHSSFTFLAKLTVSKTRKLLQRTAERTILYFPKLAPAHHSCLPQKKKQKYSSKNFLCFGILSLV